MPKPKKPFRTLAPLQFQPTSFTLEECERAVEAVFAEKRRRTERAARGSTANDGDTDAKNAV
jgi:hypothetical protein